MRQSANQNAIEQCSKTFHLMKQPSGSNSVLRFTADRSVACFLLLTFGFLLNPVTQLLLCPILGETPSPHLGLFWKRLSTCRPAADQPVRGGEGHALFTHLPLQAQAAPATAVPIAAGERRQVMHRCNTLMGTIYLEAHNHMRANDMEHRSGYYNKQFSYHLL